MASRIFLITGSTDGIGKHTAIQLAKTGATVIIHGRNPNRLAETEKEIKREYKNANIKAYCADFASIGGVKKLAADVKKDFTHIDVLINNAAVVELERNLSREGYEMTFAVNVISPILLSSLLLDLIKRSEEPHIINVASISQSADLNFHDLQMENNYNGKKQYEVSKTCLIMLTYELEEMLRPLKIRVNTLDPGTVNTKMLLPTWGPIGIDVNEANNILHLATLDKYRNESRKYFIDGVESTPMAICADVDKRKKLWDIIIGITGATFDV